MKRESAIITKGEPKTEGPRTYVVFGTMRGGTTMISGVMQGLGIFMGDHIDENNQESADFSNKPIEHMRETIERQNLHHQIWGWKFPNAADYLDHIWPQLRNIHMICVFRDCVANGQGLNRWHPFGPIQAAQEAALRQQKNLNLIALRQCPSILISYEKAERNKDLFLEEFAALLGQSVDHNKFDFNGFMRASAYKKLTDFWKR